MTNELTDYLEAVAALDGLPGWYGAEQARLRADEQQAKLKAEAAAGRRREEITAHLQLVETSLNDARTALRDVALGQLVPASIKPGSGKPSKGADDLARDIKDVSGDIRRLSRKLKAHRQAASERRLAEEEAARERERQRQLEEAERRRREREAALTAAEAWQLKRQQAMKVAGAAAACLTVLIAIVGLAIGLPALIGVGVVVGIAAFAGLKTALGPKRPMPSLPDQEPT